jgi:hypothetical protein
MTILTLPTSTVNIGIVRERHGLRAPRGGCTVAGKVFKGGQFCLPYDPINPHGVEVEAARGLDLTAFASKTMTVGPTPAKFSIYGFNYTASEIDPGECGTVAYRLHKIETNNSYDVILNHFGELTCDCPDYVARHEGNGTSCKHGRKLVELGLVPAPTPIPAKAARREFTAAAPVATPAPRRRRFEPSPQEMAEAAQIFAEVTAERVAYHRELAAAL